MRAGSRGQRAVAGSGVPGVLRRAAGSSVGVAAGAGAAAGAAAGVSAGATDGATDGATEGAVAGAVAGVALTGGAGTASGARSGRYSGPLWPQTAERSSAPSRAHQPTPFINTRRRLRPISNPLMRPPPVRRPAAATGRG